jgi:hypothetical protein
MPSWLIGGLVVLLGLCGAVMFFRGASRGALPDLGEVSQRWLTEERARKQSDR